MKENSSPNKSHVEDDNDIVSDVDFEDDSIIPDVKNNERSKLVRHRIDDLLERKRLRELIDDAYDWDI